MLLSQLVNVGCDLSGAKGLKSISGTVSHAILAAPSRASGSTSFLFRNFKATINKRPVTGIAMPDENARRDSHKYSPPARFQLASARTERTGGESGFARWHRLISHYDTRRHSASELSVRYEIPPRIRTNYQDIINTRFTNVEGILCYIVS